MDSPDDFYDFLFFLLIRIFVMITSCLFRIMKQGKSDQFVLKLRISFEIMAVRNGEQDLPTL